MYRLIIFGLILGMVACKGSGDRAPVMVNETPAFDEPATEHVANIANQKENVSVEHEEGISTIAAVLKSRKKLDGETVTVKGKVTKYNPAIMGLNWVHIQDGTEYSGQFDLTITTTEVVNVGDEVIFTGTIAIDRDFGYGYRYSTLMEKATLKK